MILLNFIKIYMKKRLLFVRSVPFQLLLHFVIFFLIPFASSSQALTCLISGSSSLCNGSTGNIYSISSNTAGATFSTVISGNGTIIGSTTGPSINVTAGAAGSFTLTTTVTANGNNSTCTKTVTVTTTGDLICTI